MTRDTPPKHKTPNYKLVEREYSFNNSPFQSPPIRLTHRVFTWEPAPLRADRKDLGAATATAVSYTPKARLGGYKPGKPSAHG